MRHPANDEPLFNGLPLLSFKAGNKSSRMRQHACSLLCYTPSRFSSDRSPNASLLTPFAFSECLACIMGIREGETPQGNASFTHTRLPVYQGTHLSLSQADRLYCVIIHSRKGLRSKSTLHML